MVEAVVNPVLFCMLLSLSLFLSPSLEPCFVPNAAQVFGGEDLHYLHLSVKGC